MKGRRFEDADYDAWLLKQEEENCHDSDDVYEYDEDERDIYEAEDSEVWHDKWGW